MRLILSLIASLLINRSAGTVYYPKPDHDTHYYYVIEYIPISSLDDVANALGVEVVGRAGELKDHLVVRAEKPLGLARRGEPELEDRVLSTLESLRVRAESSPLAARSEGAYDARSIVDSVRYISRQTLSQRSKRAPPSIRPPSSASSRGIAQRLNIHDPYFIDQWHLVNDEHPEHMMNATPVWEMGITGKGVTVSFIDDGLDYTSDDLSKNFDAEDSYDFNEHVKLPTPTKELDHHGTRCAGQVAAQKNNVCGVGIAYDSNVAGVRILSGHITDVDEAAALNYGYHNVDLYSCSWGPPDNGKTMQGPEYLIKKAIVNGINNGRQGKGSIFVFASGNGGGFGDQCNFDGYTNSIYSVTVSAVDHTGKHPYYAESCAANMVVAYSSGDGKSIVTTDRGKEGCTSSHGGTSAAAPNAVGVFALALEVRPDLTWRDIQHLCVQNARMINPDDPDWEKMASGKLYSYKYGFGVLDAYKYVTAAKEWNLVKPQAWLETPTIQLANGTYSSDGDYAGGVRIGREGVESKMVITREMMLENNVEMLEHVNLKVWINHTKRGDVHVELISPHGVRSVLASRRRLDVASTGFPGWTFMSVKHWGEDPIGEWTIKVYDQNVVEEEGTFLGWNMILWGSTIDSSKAKRFETPLIDYLLPPPVSAPSRPIIAPATPSTSTIHSKPTAHLPEDHGSAKGENSNPAFSTPSTTPGGDSSVLGDLADLMSTQKWFFLSLGGITLSCIIGLLVYFKRRQNRAGDQIVYSAIENPEEMRTILANRGGLRTGGPRTAGRPRTARFATGGGPEDDEPRGAVGLGFHSAFLDDDDLSTGGDVTTPAPKYQDLPEDGDDDGELESVRGPRTGGGGDARGGDSLNPPRYS